MAMQPPLSPWMDETYQEKNVIKKVPVLSATGQRDLCWLKKDYPNWQNIKQNNKDIRLNNISWKNKPDQTIRMIDHWDNFNGTVERGYAGRSIFFDGNKFRKDWKLIKQYAELLQSIRINAISINNVNVRENARFFITNKNNNLDNIKIITDIFAQHNIKTFISINFAAPKIVGGLETSDPLNPKVINFWEKTANQIYKAVPNFGGFLVKADAEGEPGPYQYNRNHADGANVLAKAIKKYKGLVIWRCFVYNHYQDWRAAGEYKVDRMKSAFENFFPLDGQFDSNVALQIKYGPADFQINEPISPLFSRLTKTNKIMEFQITQEYTGQQQHICYLAPIWQEIYKTLADGENKLSKIIPETSPVATNSGISAVGNVGTDANWTGHKLAQANLYAYGRMAWDNSLTAKQIAKEWIELSFPELNNLAKQTIYNILLTSRQTYRNYTAPLGTPSAMCNPGYHYDPFPEGYEYDRWGIYQFPNRDGFGIDRTKSGTGYTEQYLPVVAKKYTDIDKCPEELLAFFHFVPFKKLLKSGKTVIQHIYDTHFEGVETVKKYIVNWKKIQNQKLSNLELKLWQENWQSVFDKLQKQLRSAKNWRDFLNTYYHRLAGTPDKKSRRIYR
ncbi:MAG: alpha-glucuronidase [Bifidobacteriaceae bacterium]|nr:alpha-glucuronidase [Bifidobacteriaceae bacterium]